MWPNPSSSPRHLLLLVLLPTALSLDLVTPRTLHAYPSSPLRPPFWTYTTGQTTIWEVIDGDFNEDDQLDVASLGEGISILIGDGAGGFSQVQLVTLSLEGQDLEVADFDNDGHLDLVTVGSDVTGVEFHAGYGDGLFGPAVISASSVPLAALVSADFDGDGFRDLLGLDWGSSVIRFHGAGDGSFSAASLTVLPYGLNNVATGLINDDAHPDVAITMWDFSLFDHDSVLVWFGDGAGGFPGRTALHAEYPWSVSIADVEGDGDSDLLVSGLGPLDLFHGNGDGTFLPRVTLNPGSEIDHPVPIDVDGDGVRDLAFSAVESGGDFVSLASWLGVLPGLKGGGYGSLVKSRMSALGGMIIADVDGDGLLDGVSASWGSVTVAKGHGNSSFGEGGQFIAAPFGPIGVGIDDLSGGGGPADIVLITTAGCEYFHTGSVSSWLGNGDGTYVPGPSQNMGYGFCPTGMVLDHFDADGLPDLAYYFQGGNQFTVRPGNGEGTFQAGGNPPAGGAVRRMIVGDWNADGIKDFAFTVTGGKVSIVMGAPGGVFLPPALMTLGGNLWSLAAGQIDAGPTPDLAIIDGGTTVRTLFGNGNGIFNAGPTRSIGPAAESVALPDLSNDGIAELVVTREALVDVAPGNGNGTFGPAVTLIASSGARDPVAADFDKDGRSDLLVMNYDDASLSLFLAGEGGSFQPAVGLGTGMGPASLAVSDVNGDNAPDVLTADVSDRTMTLLLNAGSLSGVPDGESRAQSRLDLWPNPARGTVRLSGIVATSGGSRLQVFDAAGRLVRTLNDQVEAGPFVVLWDGHDDTGQATAPGLYFVRLKSEDEILTRKVIRFR